MLVRSEIAVQLFWDWLLTFYSRRELDFSYGYQVKMTYHDCQLSQTEESWPIWEFLNSLTWLDLSVNQSVLSWHFTTDPPKFRTVITASPLRTELNVCAWCTDQIRASPYENRTKCLCMTQTCTCQVKQLKLHLARVCHWVQVVLERLNRILSKVCSSLWSRSVRTLSSPTLPTNQCCSLARI